MSAVGAKVSAAPAAGCPMAIACLPSMPTCATCKARRTAPKLTAAQKRRVRELMVDEGETRASAVAWVTALEPDGAQ